MYKSCSKCGKMHPYNYKCNVGKIYQGGSERRLRSTNKWTKKSEEIRERANYLCEVCRDHNIITYKDLEVHHITKVKDDESLLLDNYNLICLCVKHHKQADKGELDKEYLTRLAEARENS